MDQAERIAHIAASIPKTQSKLGVFVERSGTHAIVNIGETTVTLPFVGMYLPPAGHPVQLEGRNGQLTVTGPARPLPGAGVILTVSPPLATVSAWDITYTLPYRATYEPASGDNVEIAWSADGGVIQGKVSTVVEEVIPEVAPQPTSGSFHPAPFTAIDSGSRYASGGWINPNVYASSSMTGGWFYGDKVLHSIPGHAVITLARIYLSPSRTEFGPPRLQVHTSPTKAGPLEWVGSYFELPTKSGWVDIPVGFIDYLKANPGGLGMNHGGYDIYRSVGLDSLSGALDIAWIA